MPMLHSFSSPVRPPRSFLRDRTELNLTIIYVTDCGPFKDHPSSGLQDCLHLLLLLFKYYSEMLYICIVPAGSEVMFKDM